MKTHSFKESLAFSERQSDAPWWELVYREAFPTFEAMAIVRRNGWAQESGIDRVITLASGKTITVDEKVRDKDWPDILLEYLSNVERKRPGWVVKDLACDFLAYAFVPTSTCYLLPFPTLRTAWRKNGQRWVDNARAAQRGYRIVDAWNEPGYTTRSVAVPIPEVMQALSNAMIIHWAER